MVKTAVILAAGYGSRINGSGKGMPKPLIPVVGMPLLRRVILTAKRAGIKRCVVVIGHESDRVRKVMEADSVVSEMTEFVVNDEFDRANGVSLLKAQEVVGDEPFVLLMGDHLFESATLTELMSLATAPGECVLAVDRKLDTIVDMDDATKVQLRGGNIGNLAKELNRFDAVDSGMFLGNRSLFEAMEQAVSQGREGLSDGVRILARAGRLKAFDIGDGKWQDVDTPEMLSAARNMLFSSLVSSTSGIVSRHINRKISVAISRLLVHTPLTPNLISLSTLVAGLLAAYYIAQPGYWNLVLGGLLFQTASVVDGCDGEIARLKFLESERGQWLDTLIDYTTDVAFLVGITWRMFAVSGLAWVAPLGAVAMVLTVAYVAVMLTYSASQGSGDGNAFNNAFKNQVKARGENLVNRAINLGRMLLKHDVTAMAICLAAIVNIPWAIYWGMIVGNSVAFVGVISGAVMLAKKQGMRLSGTPGDKLAKPVAETVRGSRT